MCSSGEIKDEPGHCVLNCLKFSQKLGSDSYVEGVAVVESAGDECLGDCLSGVDW